MNHIPYMIDALYNISEFISHQKLFIYQIFSSRESFVLFQFLNNRSWNFIYILIFFMFDSGGLRNLIEHLMMSNRIDLIGGFHGSL